MKKDMSVREKCLNYKIAYFSYFSLINNTM